ncbi:uncharacterized protein [Diadema setosum]|uniref:uncharacterized protein n=1 Tax=Diadema setosum TaxID=31175 RepID=UPI003B3A178A
METPTLQALASTGSGHCQTNKPQDCASHSYHSADCDTDHSLVCSKFRLHPKKFHRTKTAGKPRIDTTKMQCPDKVEGFAKSLVDALFADKQRNSASEKWDHLLETIQKTALHSFGRKTSKNCDWFEAKSNVMMPIIDAKRAVLTEYKRSPNEKSLQALRATRGKVQQTARRCANEYWQQLSNAIQTAAATGNIKRMYERIKCALGPTQTKTAPSKLLEELDVDPTQEELCKAVDSLTCGKAPGNNGIPPDLIKCCKNTLLLPPLDILCQCWREGTLPQDMRDAKIAPLYKNKDDKSDCNNYRGISLLSVVGKLFARVVLMRLQKLAERVYTES